MHLDVIKYYYNELKADSLEADVDRIWNNILPLYFRVDMNFGIEQQQRPYPDTSKTKVDFIIRCIRNVSNKKVVLIEDNRVKQESSTTIWEDAIEQVTDYMKTARVSQFKPGSPVETMYAIVTVGHYCRFYTLLPGAQQLEDYSNTGGNPFELKDDEEDIDAILLELVQKTSN